MIFRRARCCPRWGRASSRWNAPRPTGRRGKILSLIDDASAHLSCDAEREVLWVLNGHCNSPIAGYSTIEGAEMTLTASVLDEDGGALHRSHPRRPREPPARTRPRGRARTARQGRRRDHRADAGGALKTAANICARLEPGDLQSLVMTAPQYGGRDKQTGTHMMTRWFLGLILMAVVQLPAFGAELTPDKINGANFTGKLPSEDSITPLAVKVQVLLDRARFSPGEIDGTIRRQCRESAAGLCRGQQPRSGQSPDPGNLVEAAAGLERRRDCRLRSDRPDIKGPYIEKLPTKMEDMKSLKALSFTGPKEALSERFHMSQDLLAALNPGQNSTAPAPRSMSSIFRSKRRPKPRASRSTRPVKR